MSILTLPCKMELETFLNGSEFALFDLDFMNLYMCFDEPKHSMPMGVSNTNAK